MQHFLTKTKMKINTKITPIILASVIFTLQASAGCAGAIDPVKINVTQVLDKYIQAMGGMALKQVKTLSRQGTLVKGNQGKVPFEAYSENPGKWNYKQIFAYGDVVCYASDGKDFWVQDTKGVTQIQDNERMDLQLMFDIMFPLKLHDLYPDLRIRESGPSDKLKTVSLIGKSGGIEKEFEFDLETGFLLRAGDLYFTDYRQSGKLKLPFRIFIGESTDKESLRLKMEVSVVVWDSAMDQSEFDKPSCPLKAQKSQLYTLRKQVTVDDGAMEACVGVYRNTSDSTLKYIVSKQGKHLMYEIPGRSSRIEIKPESELDYFVRFLNQEYHFVKDSRGKVVQLEFGYERKIKAKRID